MIRKRTILGTLLAWLTLGSLAAVACSVPVFRYALEHWSADKYVVYLVHRGELNAAHQQLAQQHGFAALEHFLRGDVEQDAANVANAELVSVDLNTAAGQSFRPDWAELAADELPRLIVEAPYSLEPPVRVWSGDLTADHLAALLQSPARSEVSQRLLAGHSVVWVLLECGETAKDDAAYQRLTEELERLQQHLTLPELKPEDADLVTGEAGTVRIQFSALRVQRDDPQERRLVDMLLRVEPDLLEEKFRTQPVAFPVFGRGRALYALVGEGIVPAMVEDACRFLTAGCQCTVKQQNPGVDLLMSVDWQQQLDAHAASQPVKPVTPLPLMGLTGVATVPTPREPAEPVKNSKASSPASSEVQPSPGLSRSLVGRTTLLAMVALLGMIAAGGALLRRS